MTNGARYISGSKASRLLGISQQTLRAYSDKEKIESLRTPGGQRRYNVDKYIAEQVSHYTATRKSIIYAAKARMLTLSHYRFRQILTLKAKEFGTNLHVMGEEYTTKTCCCGKLNDRIGGSKTYICVDPVCGYRADRDVNGARNVFVKGLMEINVC